MMRFRTRRSRRGMALMWALGLLTVLLIVVSVLARTLVATHHEQRGDQRRLQAAFLAESGLSRAAARLAMANEYAGELWQLAPESGLDAPATIKIAVAAVEGQPQQRHVTITASCGVNEAHSAVVVKEVLLRVGASGNQPEGS